MTEHQESDRHGGVGAAVVAPSGDEGLAHEIDALAETFDVREPAAVRAYLRDNPDLLPLIRAAAREVPAYFDVADRLVLDLSQNPEDPDDDQLFVLVPTRRGHLVVRGQLARAHREWLVPTAHRTVGRLGVDVELR